MIFSWSLRSYVQLIGVLLVGSSSTFGQIESPVQSTARPFGLDIVGPVNVAGSDERSLDFQQNVLPLAQQFVSLNLGERLSIDDTSSMALDPSQLDLITTADVRTYFVGEGAGYHNTLGFNTEGGGTTSGNPLLIFPDASSSASYLSSGAAQRTLSEPLMAGDFVDLGVIDAGSHLDFFLISNGANGGSTVFSTDQSINPDGLNHVVAHALAFEDSPYLLLGFEDLLGGGDQDYNDLVFVIDIGVANVQYLTETASLDSPVVGAPEPPLTGVLVTILMTSTVFYRRYRIAGNA